MFVIKLNLFMVVKCQIRQTNLKCGNGSDVTVYIRSILSLDSTYE